MLVALILVRAVLSFPAEIANATAGLVVRLLVALPMVARRRVASGLIAYFLGAWIGRPLAVRLAGEKRVGAGARVGRGGPRRADARRGWSPFVPFSLVGYVAGAARVPPLALHVDDRGRRAAASAAAVPRHALDSLSAASSWLASRHRWWRWRADGGGGAPRTARRITAIGGRLRGCRPLGVWRRPLSPNASGRADRDPAQSADRDGRACRRTAGPPRAMSAYARGPSAFMTTTAIAVLDIPVETSARPRASRADVLGRRAAACGSSWVRSTAELDVTGSACRRASRRRAARRREHGLAVVTAHGQRASPVCPRARIVRRRCPLRSLRRAC